MKKMYQFVEIEVLYFGAEDVVRTSWSDENVDMDGGWT